MGEWDKKLVKLLTDNCISTEVATRYIDDIRLVMRPIKLGWRWNGKSMEFKETWKKEEEVMTRTAKTSSVLKEIMNSIFPNLNFTMETHEDFQDSTLPTLDTRIWMEERKVMYSYYEKPMSAKTVIMKNSALSENSKVASLSQDLVRRMKTTSQDLSMDRRIDIIDEYAAKLTRSGYSRIQTTKIIVAGLRGFERALKRHREGKTKLHRSAAEGAVKRNRKKLLDKSTWFKEKKNDKDDDGIEVSPVRLEVGARKPPGPKERSGAHKPPGPRDNVHSKDTANKPLLTTVLFVEQTPGGELARRLREAEQRLADITGWRVKVVEKSGTTLKQLLHKSNPWSGGLCGREGCFPCQAGDVDGDCFRRNILYETSCNQCKQRGQERVYVGESSRSSYERGGEHADDYRKETSDSHMHKHATTDHHGEENPTFSFKVVKSFQNALARQVSEAVRLRKRGDIVLNSKGVYNRCALPRLLVEQNEKIVGEDEPTPPPAPEMYEEEDVPRRCKRKLVETKTDQPGSKRIRRVRWCGGYKDGQEWGETGLDIAQTAFLTEAVAADGSSKTLKQGKIKLLSKAEIVGVSIVRNILDRAWNELELGCELENKMLNFAMNEFLEKSVKKEKQAGFELCQATPSFSQPESGVELLIDAIIDRALKRGEMRRKVKASKLAKMWANSTKAQPSRTKPGRDVCSSLTLELVHGAIKRSENSVKNKRKKSTQLCPQVRRKRKTSNGSQAVAFAELNKTVHSKPTGKISTKGRPMLSNIKNESFKNESKISNLKVSSPANPSRTENCSKIIGGRGIERWFRKVVKPRRQLRNSDDQGPCDLTDAGSNFKSQGTEGNEGTKKTSTNH